MKKWVSEEITQDKIKSWKNGDIITIQAGTGAGKSRFIKVSLYAHAKRQGKKILFLIHRKQCVNQFQMEIEKDKKTDVIEIMTYQKIEHEIRKGLSFDFSKYQYIVADEFHYFIEGDASFNKFTDLSLKAILEQNDKIRILMSATADITKRYINNFEKIETEDYKLPVTHDAINTLTFFNNDESMEEFCTLAIKNNLKVVFFIDKAEKAYNLYKKFKKYAMFNCSKSNKYYKHVDEKLINDMLLNEKFEKLILITTMSLSTGINIKDTELKHIVCDVKDIGTLIQCIGRKRIQNDHDKFNLLIKNINNQRLGGMETQLKLKIKMAEYLRKNGIDKFLHKYQRNYDESGITYDVMENGQLVKKLNMLMYSKNLIDIVEIQRMLGNYGKSNLKIKYAYCKYMTDKLGKYDEENNYYDYEIWEDKKENVELVNYLGGIVGNIMLQVKDRQELIEKINVKQNGKLLKSLDSLNAALKEQNMDYFIKQFETSRMTDGKKKKYKSAWKVMKLVDR